MADVQIAVRLRWETGANGFATALSQIFLYNLFNKIFGDRCGLFFFSFLFSFFFPLFPPQRLLQIFSAAPVIFADLLQSADNFFHHSTSP